MTTLNYVAFPSLHASPLTLAARLRTPPGEGRRPAVVILHGAEGPSRREGAYAEALGAAGFITLEPDEGASREVHERLPNLFAARQFLADRAEVDAGRIGVIGFGLGGAVVMLAATSWIDQSFTGAHASWGAGSFAAYLPFYPLCHLYNRAPGFEFAGLVPAPILIATAALDDYDDDPAAGPELVKSLRALDRIKIRTAVFYGARHAFDLPGVDGHVEDPLAHRGQGGTVTLSFDPEAAARAHELAVRFFQEMKAAPVFRRSEEGKGF